MRASAGAWRTSSGRGCGRSASGSRCSASPTCRRSRRAATTQFRIEKRVRGGRTVDVGRAADDAARVEEIARMIGGAVVSEQVRALRDADADGCCEPLRRDGDAKAKGESESRRGESDSRGTT